MKRPAAFRLGFGHDPNETPRLILAALLCACILHDTLQSFQQETLTTVAQIHRPISAVLRHSQPQPAPADQKPTPNPQHEPVEQKVEIAKPPEPKPQSLEKVVERPPQTKAQPKAKPMVQPAQPEVAEHKAPIKESSAPLNPPAQAVAMDTISYSELQLLRKALQKCLKYPEGERRKNRQGSLPLRFQLSGEGKVTRLDFLPHSLPKAFEVAAGETMSCVAKQGFLKRSSGLIQLTLQFKLK